MTSETMNINEYQKEDVIYALCVSLSHPFPVEMFMNGDFSFELRAIRNGNKKEQLLHFLTSLFPGSGVHEGFFQF